MNESQRIKFAQALTKYSPDKLSRYLKRAPDGTVYVDRDRIVKSANEESMFSYVLTKDYLSGYKDIEFMTVFFESSKNDIIGGAYNPISQKKISRRRLISADVRTPYTYTEEDIEKFKNILNNA